MTDTLRISINVPQRRVYYRGDPQAAYDWLCERFDAFDLIGHSFTLELADGELRASDGWVIERGLTGRCLPGFDLSN
jgi:hypothetical protein